jgi:hypothetical protein
MHARPMFFLKYQPPIYPLRFPPLSVQAGVAGFFIGCPLCRVPRHVAGLNVHAAATPVNDFMLAVGD